MDADIATAMDMDSIMDESPVVRPFPFEMDNNMNNNHGTNIATHSALNATYSNVNQFAHLYRPKTARGDDDDEDDDHHHHHHHGRRFVSTSRPQTSMRRSALSRLRGQEVKRDAIAEADAER